VVDADDTQTVTTVVDQHPDLALTKSFLTTPTIAGDPANTADHAGQVIHYTVVVTNTGNVDLSGVAVTDSQGNILTGGSATLGAGLSETLTGTLTVTQAEIDAGTAIVNTASVTATNVVVDADDTQTVTTTIDQHGPTENGTASLTVQEAALDTTMAGLDLAAGLVMGSNPSSTLETATSTGLTFTAGTSAITGMAFGTNLAGISVTGVVASASFFWEIVGGVLIGHLSTTHTATAADPIAIELALSGTETANPGATAAPTITATLTDAFPDAGTTSATVNGIQVVATDGSATHATVSGNVSVTVIDDTPSIGAIANAIMPSVSLTDVHGTWAPVFGADGVANQQPNPNGAFPTIPYGAILPAGTAAITIALPGQGSPVGTTTDPLGHTENVYSVAETANNGSGTFTYNIFEYSFYNPATQTAEVLAFGDAALTQAFFTLSMNANGTYVFDLESNSLLSSETFSVSGGTPNGNGEFVEVNTSGVGAYGSGAIPAPSNAFPLIIDGFTSTDTNPLDHRVFKDTNGFGIDQSNLQPLSTLSFDFLHQQTDVVLVAGKATVVETAQVQLFDSSHTLLATETINLTPDASHQITLTIDAAAWTGTGTNAFQPFFIAEVENTGPAKFNPLSLTFDQTTVIGGTTLTFTPTITDGDGNTATGGNLSVALNGTTNASGGYDLTGTGTNVLVASAHADHLTGSGTSTVDYSNSPTGVTVDLTNNPGTESASGGWATGDVISGFENVIGSSLGGNTLTGASGGSSSLVGGSSGTDTLIGAGGHNVLIDLGATDTMTGGAGGNNLFVFENPLSGHTATITDFSAIGNEIVVNVADQAYTPQTGGAILASQLFSGAPSDTHVNDSFFVQTISATQHDLWFSANGTAAAAIDIAHLGTGIPTAAQIHTH
jgi:uncharacterized repeat protein (TIGR01451 family)